MNWGLTANLVGCALSIGVAIRTYYRSRRIERDYERVRREFERDYDAAAVAHYSAIIASLMPAVRVCILLVEDQNTPAVVREAARLAIPNGLHPTKTTVDPHSTRIH